MTFKTKNEYLVYYTAALNSLDDVFYDNGTEDFDEYRKEILAVIESAADIKFSDDGIANAKANERFSELVANLNSPRPSSYSVLRGLGFPPLVAIEAILRGYRTGLLPFSAVRKNRVFKDK